MRSKNEEIASDTVKLVDEQGKYLGEMPFEQAMVRAREIDLDLIQMSSSDPPTCRIGDYGKLIYEEKKKAKNVQRNEVKEVKFRPTTEEHDFMTKMKSIEKFFSRGNRVKITIRFKGREVSHADLGWSLVRRIIDQSGARVLQGPSMENNTIHALLERV